MGSYFSVPGVAQFAHAVDVALRKRGAGTHRPDGTGLKPIDRYFADDAREHFLDRELTNPPAHWKSYARASLFAAFAEKDPAQLRAALITHAAVIAEWVNDIDNRE